MSLLEQSLIVNMDGTQFHFGLARGEWHVRRNMPAFPTQTFGTHETRKGGRYKVNGEHKR
jgi:hypothetical protein